jgi:hypothetical protein
LTPAVVKYKNLEKSYQTCDNSVMIRYTCIMQCSYAQGSFGKIIPNMLRPLYRISNVEALWWGIIRLWFERSDIRYFIILVIIFFFQYHNIIYSWFVSRRCRVIFMIDYGVSINDQSTSLLPSVEGVDFKLLASHRVRFESRKGGTQKVFQHL